MSICRYEDVQCTNKIQIKYLKIWDFFEVKTFVAHQRNNNTNNMKREEQLKPSAENQFSTVESWIVYSSPIYHDDVMSRHHSGTQMFSLISECLQLAVTSCIEWCVWGLAMSNSETSSLLNRFEKAASFGKTQSSVGNGEPIRLDWTWIYCYKCIIKIISQFRWEYLSFLWRIQLTHKQCNLITSSFLMCLWWIAERIMEK